MAKIPLILVVDDDPNLRKTLSDILKIKGYAVAAAADGAAGIAQAQLAAVNVALIDLKLPDMTGIEVMEQIKACSPNTEAIILTGHASLESAVEATNKGAFSYLLKPYEIDDLLLHIHHAVARQQDQEEIRRLASFPKLDPNPVIEISLSGEVTYTNPAAEKQFPDMVSSHGQYPLLTGLEDVFAAFRQSGLTESVREVVIGKTTYEQHLYYVPESALVRITILDITERKAHEARGRRMNALLRAMLNINQHLLVAESEEELYRFVCTAMLGVEHVVAAWVGLKLPDFSVNAAAWAGFDEATVARFNVRWDAAGGGLGIMGKTIREGNAVVAKDIENDPLFAPWREVMNQWKIKSGAGVPLVADGDVIGALAVYSGQAEAFDEGSVNFLAEVASDIAVGVRSLRLGKQLHATLNSLRKSMDSTIEAIASIMELRDPYTVGHQKRVAQLACAIGREMGLHERQIEGLHVTGFLHDIGKIAVPAEILSRPTALSEIEHALVETHAKAGYDILKNLDFPWPVAQAVLQHHERLDGSGYPQGLKAQDIILEARILMVADVVEAIASHRPYRASRGIGAALNEITANRGKLYDADVVDICIGLFTRQGFRFTEIPEPHINN